MAIWLPWAPSPQQERGIGAKMWVAGRGSDSFLREWEALPSLLSVSALLSWSINNWLIPNDSALVKGKLCLGAVQPLRIHPVSC